MYGLNRAEVIGRLGADPEIRYNENGNPRATFSVATDESYTDKNNQRVDKTEWHRIVTFQSGLVNTIAQHAHKGRQVFVSGKLQTRSWVDQQGVKHYSTEIMLAGYASSLQFLDKPKRNGNGEHHPNAPAAETTEAAAPEAAAAATDTADSAADPLDDDNDIPF